MNNESKLEAALETATDPTALTFIEVKFKPMDTPRGMPVFGNMAREYDYGNWPFHGQEVDENNEHR